MIKISRGKYKNITLKIDYNGDIIIKASKKVADLYIKNFIESKQKWIQKQLKKIAIINKIKQRYNFRDNVYLFNKEILYLGNKRDFYKNAFTNEIVPLVKELAEQCNLSYSSINLTNSKRIWGSLNNKKEMSLNWKIVILPKTLIEYIIIHELCHSKEFNHSKNFWNLVSSYLKDYKIRKEQLKKYCFLLQENIL